MKWCEIPLLRRLLALRRVAPSTLVAAPASAEVRPPNPDDLEAEIPIMISPDARVAMGLSCRDCDMIPKVAGAGRIEIQPDGTRAQLMHNGLKVLAGGYYGEWMTDLIQGLRGHHEPQEERLFHELVRLLPADATMIELGSFWSYYTLWFMKGWPHRRGIALEADPAHLAVGRANAEINSITPVFVNAVAGESDAPPAAFQTEVSGIIDLPLLSVPGLMRAHGLERLDLLHCDAQGAEYAVLRGCVELIEARRLGWVCVSTHHHNISADPLTHQRCLALLRRAGAYIEAEHDVQESFSGDGLILARCGPPLPGWRTPVLSRNRSSTSLFRDPLYDLAALRAQRQRGVD